MSLPHSWFVASMGWIVCLGSPRAYKEGDDGGPRSSSSNHSLHLTSVFTLQQFPFPVFGFEQRVLIAIAKP